MSLQDYVTGTIILAINVVILLLIYLAVSYIRLKNHF